MCCFCFLLGICQALVCMPSAVRVPLIGNVCLINAVHEMYCKRSVLKLSGLNCVVTSLRHVVAVC